MPEAARIGDERSPRRLLGTTTVFEGRVWDVVSEQFTLTVDGEPITREFIRHPGAVAVLVLDDRERVLLMRQYRHPVRMALWEIPAGLLDIRGEDFLDAAARELAEEADLTAAQWHVLIDLFLSPGSSSEALRVYLARGVGEVAVADLHTRTHEEAEITLAWVGLDDAVTMVLEGRIHSPSAAAAILAAKVARERGFADLRPATTPWPEHPSQHASWPGGAVVED